VQLLDGTVIVPSTELDVPLPQPAVTEARDELIELVGEIVTLSKIPDDVPLDRLTAAWQKLTHEIEESGEPKRVNSQTLRRIVWGEVSFVVEEGHAPAMDSQTGEMLFDDRGQPIPVPVKVLILRDQVSEITVHVPLTIEWAEQMGTDLLGQKIVPARRMPTEPPPGG
jgi:hypothetical protein